VHPRPRLGELLVQTGYITSAQLEGALQDQLSWGGRLGQNLLDHGLIDEQTLAAAIARQFQLRVVDLERTPPPEDVTRLVPVSIAERYGLVAIAIARARGRIVVACVDPTNNDAMREVRRATGLIPEACVATATQIDRVVRQHYYGEADPVPSLDPHLDVTRGARARSSGDGDRLEGVERRLDDLLGLVQKDRGSG
jgi:type IV pilus assembly protein PilB